jgi:hypothetical protein
MTSAGLEPATSAVNRLKTYSLDRSTTGIDPAIFFFSFFLSLVSRSLSFYSTVRVTVIVALNDNDTRTHTR